LGDKKQLVAECSMCHRIQPIRIKYKLICFECYKKVHAQDERARRGQFPERYREYEKRRNKTEKRRKWTAQYNREYYQRNKEKLIEYQRQWRKDHPERRDGYKVVSRKRRSSLPDTLTEEEWLEILNRFDYSCAYCQTTTSQLEEEHLIPVCKGGERTIENIVPACHSCNSSKGTQDLEDFIGLGYAKNPHPMLFEYIESI